MSPPPADLLGAHVSVAGGIPRAPARARTIGARAIQIFTKTPNQWRERAVTAHEAQQFRQALNDHGVLAAVSHDSYLINLASPERSLRRRSIAALTRELRRAERLGLSFVVSHPGNYLDERASGLARNADGYAESLERAGGRVRLAIETTAGSGTVLGWRFEELAAIIARLPPAARDRVAICADTCHLFAAGYDLTADFDGVWREFDALLGMDRLAVLHLNDSRAPLGSRRDRHELIGEGHLGPAPFRRIMTDPCFAHVVKVIETPKLDDPVRTDRRMLRRLRGYARHSASSVLAPARGTARATPVRRNVDATDEVC